jgi:uncharacterized protein (DUF2252 family)
MAADLADTPSPGLVVQVCGDAHISNFGGFAAPDRRRSEYDTHGERVVRGQRMMQAATDIFLSWQRSPDLEGIERDFYVRQLWDWKASADLSRMTEHGLRTYTRACAWSLARSHARSGDRLAIAAYLGKGRSFDRAIARFSALYADQNELDHRRLRSAVRSGEIEAREGI